jgi:hypothetical protein
MNQSCSGIELHFGMIPAECAICLHETRPSKGGKAEGLLHTSLVLRMELTCNPFLVLGCPFVQVGMTQSVFLKRFIDFSGRCHADSLAWCKAGEPAGSDYTDNF